MTIKPEIQITYRNWEAGNLPPKILSMLKTRSKKANIPLLGR